MDSQISYPDLSELQQELDDLETSEDRIQFLIELGQSLPHFPEEYCTEEFRVVGCQSMVWIVPSWDGHSFHFSASSDAPMVRGLVAVLNPPIRRKLRLKSQPFRLKRLSMECICDHSFLPFEATGCIR